MLLLPNQDHETLGPVLNLRNRYTDGCMSLDSHICMKACIQLAKKHITAPSTLRIINRKYFKSETESNDISFLSLNNNADYFSLVSFPFLFCFFFVSRNCPLHNFHYTEIYFLVYVIHCPQVGPTFNKEKQAMETTGCQTRQEGQVRRI